MRKQQEELKQEVLKMRVALGDLSVKGKENARLICYLFDRMEYMSQLIATYEQGGEEIVGDFGTTE